MLEFSIPMQYNNDTIREILTLNESLREDRKITSVFGALAQDTKECLGWENYRDHSSFNNGRKNDLQCISDIMPFVKQFQDAGISFQYCINSTRHLSGEMLYDMRKKVFWFCDNLLRNGITHLKVSNLLLFDFIHEYYKNAFTYYLSTTREYSSIDQYGKLFGQYPDMKEVCLPTDLNRDIMFLKNFLGRFPDVNPEIMVNEGCIYACPWRKDHTPHSSETHIADFMKLRDTVGSTMPERMVYYYTSSCRTCRKTNIETVEEYFLRRSILPWNLPYYENLGIVKIKFAGRDIQGSYLINSMKRYIEAIDNANAADDLPWCYFNNYDVNNIMAPHVTIKDVKPYIVGPEFFEKAGHECHAKCGHECNICRTMAGKFYSEKIMKGAK